MSETLYTLTELEKVLKVTRRTIYNYIKSGKLDAVKIGGTWRVTQEALDRFLAPSQEQEQL